MPHSILFEKLLQLPSANGKPEVLMDFAKNFEKYDITLDDAAELIEIATNRKLLDGSEQEFFALHYAIYALGALKYIDACAAFFTQFDRAEDVDDEWSESFSDAFELMGEAVIPTLIEAMKTINLESIYLITEAIGKLAVSYPDYRSDILQALDELHQRFLTTPIKPTAFFKDQTPILMAWMDMKAVERIELIRSLFAQHKFDESYAGPIENIEYEFGLRAERPARLSEFGRFADTAPQPFVRTEVKVGRNEPCPCGSGKKYKKCCNN